MALENPIMVLHIYLDKNEATRTMEGRARWLRRQYGPKVLIVTHPHDFTDVCVDPKVCKVWEFTT